ncbi:MAG TPA: alpha/beta fold hydrolase [Acetobacteraceae bacterium]|nr:alpha/beta fold hydrolase [Acetobacteraceae bacterium]
MSGFILRRDNAALQGTDTGTGALTVLFQHGLGGSEAQVAENFPPAASMRRITLECRAQGGSTAGTARPFSIAMFSDDVLAACDARGVDAFVAGGISMGAAIALRLAVRVPARVRGLILARPAWLFDPAPANLRPYAEVATLLRAHPPEAAKARFTAGATAQMLARDAPDNLASLLGFFDRPDPALTATLLADIAADGPGVSRAEAAALRIPTLVIGHAVDHAHPLAAAEALTAASPGARLVQIPPKATEREAHVAAMRAAIRDFLLELGRSAEAAPGPAPHAAPSDASGHASWSMLPRAPRHA